MNFEETFGITPKKLLLIIADLALNLIIIIGFVFIIRTYLISPFQVFGPSMCDTLNNIEGKCQRGFGEYIIVNKLGYLNILGWQIGTPNRGDVVVFHPPHNSEEFFIKRVIGLPGETVKLKNGEVYIYNEKNPQGFKLNETYLNTYNKGNTHPYTENFTSFEVPAGTYFVLGDNRNSSSDSRSCFKEKASDPDCGEGNATSYLPMANIEGQAWLILWPLDKISALSVPNYNN